MEDKWKRYFIKWSETEMFQQKVREAEDIISTAGRYSNPAILFSGGKDSTVGVHLTLQQFPNIPIFHYDFTYNMPRPIAKELIDNLKAIGGKNIIIEKEYSKVKGDKGFFSAINKFLKDNNVDVVLSCLRAEESGKRKRLIDDKKDFLGVRNIFPIGSWDWRDVWAYIVVNNLPYPKVYDKYAKFYGWDKARFSAFFSEDLDYLGARNVDNVLMWKIRNKL